MLRVENLVKRYRKVTAVDNLSFDIGEGQIYGFVGANGAGKTTTLKILAGLLMPDEGRVILDGIDISRNPGEVKKRIGYMPDFFGVYDDLKVIEYMEFYGMVYGLSRDLCARMTRELIELVNLEDKMDAYVDSLSRGMKQRLCLARSLLHNPRLLILDEPASGLDPRARMEMKEILKELKSMGKTIIISSHILPELAELCTAIGIIDRGKMVVSGSVDEILAEVEGGKVIKIKVMGDMKPAVMLLKEQVFITRVIQSEDCITAHHNGDERQLVQLLRLMIERGIPVVHFAEAEKNLESVFMNISRGGYVNAG